MVKIGGLKIYVNKILGPSLNKNANRNIHILMKL